ncbi:nitroreductase/quinone reductase family protein [Frigoribacterium sp. UYMn621]|uniref:nitroreductase/quinone reductase family protein n=1 Tax=Frigoribacterium sp. UYMn621 TaxID=3156343 RepID=UPI00339726A7
MTRLTKVSPVKHPGVFPLGWWIAVCAVAEAIGMSAAAAAARAPEFVVGVAGSASGILGLLLIVGGGLIEGVALGGLQSIALKRWLPGLSRLRWIVLTVLVAGLGWAAASTPSQLSSVTDDSTPMIVLIVVGAAALGTVMGAVLGAVQAGGFVPLVSHPWRWIGISALAWAPTMTIIFLGATTPGPDWKYPLVIMSGTATGVVAGAVLGLVSGLLAPSLDGQSTANRLVALLLSSPARTVLSKSLVLLRIRGHVTGNQFELPVQLARTSNGLIVVPGHPERKKWWRNLRRPSAIEVLIDGAWQPATAVVTDTSEARYPTLIAEYRQRWHVPVAKGTPLVLVTFEHTQPGVESVTAA